MAERTRKQAPVVIPLARVQVIGDDVRGSKSWGAQENISGREYSIAGPWYLASVGSDEGLEVKVKLGFG